MKEGQLALPESVTKTLAKLPETRGYYHEKFVYIAPLSKEDLRLSQMDDDEVELEILSNLSKMQTAQS